MQFGDLFLKANGFKRGAIGREPGLAGLCRGVLLPCQRYEIVDAAGYGSAAEKTVGLLSSLLQLSLAARYDLFDGCHLAFETCRFAQPGKRSGTGFDSLVELFTLGELQPCMLDVGLTSIGLDLQDQIEVHSAGAGRVDHLVRR